MKQDYSDTVAEGDVIDQDPTQGTLKPQGSTITLTVSQGQKPAADVTVPNLKGRTPEDANSLLKSLGLTPVAGNSVEDQNVESGKIASQDQPAGSTAKEGDSITYHVSKGVGTANAGNHAGQELNSAKSDLNNNGFTVIDDSQTEYSDSVAKGCVIRQSPTGTQSKDTTITLVVSKGSEPKPATPTAATTSAATTSASTSSSSSNNANASAGSSSDSSSSNGSSRS